MVLTIIRKVIPLVSHFISALKDGKLSPDELEALALETGLAVAEILKDVGLARK